MDELQSHDLAQEDGAGYTGARRAVQVARADLEVI